MFTVTVLVLTVFSFVSLVSAQTPTVTAPNPQSGIQFIPQRAYVTTLTPDNLPVQFQPVQQQSDGTLNSIIPALVASAAAYFAAKKQGDNKVAKAEEKTAKVATAVQEVILPEVVKGKENTKELARVTYEMNPEAASKITNAPSVKAETLADDAARFAEKATRTSLPTKSNNDA